MALVITENIYVSFELVTKIRKDIKTQPSHLHLHILKSHTWPIIGITYKLTRAGILQSNIRLIAVTVSYDSWRHLWRHTVRWT
jgi:hypothetical protein